MNIPLDPKESSGLDWTVEEINANFVEYREGDYVAIVPGGVLTGEANEPGYVLYSVLFDRWQKPFEKEPLTPEKKWQVINRISFFLISKGLVTEIDE